MEITIAGIINLNGTSFGSKEITMMELDQVPETKVEKKADSVEITVSMSGAIPTASFENFRPLYSIKKSYSQNLSENEIENITEKMREKLQNKLDEDFLRGIKKRIEKQRKDLRLYEFDGKIYPSVTTILNPYGIDYDPYLLAQFAARGTIVHKIAENMIIQIQNGVKLADIELLDPKECNSIADEVKLVENGTLGLTWKSVSPKGFWKKYGKHFDLEKAKTEMKVKSDKYLFAGTLDLRAKYRNIPCVLDWKTSKSYSGEKLENYKQQLAAYAKNSGADIGIIAPLKPQNKSGYGKPIIVEKEELEQCWGQFLQAREKFREIYGM